MENKQLTETQLQALLRLKRHEQPPPGYFDDLLHAVHRRQREELLRRPAWRIFCDRISAFFASLRVDWAYTASMAALLMIGVGLIQILTPRTIVHQPARAIAALPAAAESAPAALQLNAAPRLEIVKIERNRPREKREQSGAPVRFVMDAQPASYEHPRIRF